MLTHSNLPKKNRVTSNSFINDLTFEIASPNNADTKKRENTYKNDSFKPSKHDCAFSQINVLRQRTKIFDVPFSFKLFNSSLPFFFTELTMFCTVLVLFCVGVKWKLYCNQSECRNFFMYSSNRCPWKVRYSSHRVKSKSHVLRYKIVF